MTPAPTTGPSTAEFELRVQQAIQSAMYSTSQVVVLLIQLEAATRDSSVGSGPSKAVQNSALVKLRGRVRETDNVTPLDHGQIGVLLRSVQSPKDINLIISRLVGQLSEYTRSDETAMTMALRIGVGVFPDHGESVSGVLEHARNDLALAVATSRSHNAYTPQSQSRVASRLWMSELRQAIVKDQLFLTFQPKLSLSQHHVTGVEVLVRWQHPEHGIILPDQFIPFAERTGLIIPMTLWVLQQSLIQCHSWGEMNLETNVAVNLSMWNLEAQELPDQIDALLHDTGVPPENLELEITETSIMNDPQRVIRTLNKIRDLGVKFAIDDFGTGYSSFAYLTKLPVSCIKIDKSFVQNIEADRDSSVIVKSIIDLGHNLGLKVVAEGVETAEAMELLRSYQCDEIQGYYLCRPITAEMMTKFLQDPPGKLSDRRATRKGDWQTVGQTGN
jgi:EAL domain-containing protein (putative c-di-GMP-specific phosphodiesterase class I)